MSYDAYGYVSADKYKTARNESASASKNAKEYREKYLELRKTMREYFSASGMTPPERIRKMIGMK